jgi:hypothetical protein
MSTAVYGAGDGSVVRVALAHITAASFGQCIHLGPAVYQPFSAILGVFNGGTAILGVFGGATAQKRLDTNVGLCGQVVLSFELQPPALMYHCLAIFQPFPSPKYNFLGVKHGKSAPVACIFSSLSVPMSVPLSRESMEVRCNDGVLGFRVPDFQIKSHFFSWVRKC